MKNFLIAVCVLAILVGGFYFLNKKEVVPSEVPTKTEEGVPVFTWKFEEAKTLNPDGNPNTNVYLEVKYSDGEVVKKLIQESNGGCNELPENEKDSFVNSKDIQCYYAGFGYKFKIVKAESSYLIMKKEFEEGSPDVEPIPQHYKLVTEFPF